MVNSKCNFDRIHAVVLMTAVPTTLLHTFASVSQYIDTMAYSSTPACELSIVYFLKAVWSDFFCNTVSNHLS